MLLLVNVSIVVCLLAGLCLRAFMSDLGADAFKRFLLAFFHS
ncbi:putative membrane protein [Synechococcus sp. BIOS-U3-1]|nr:putative membrane protein [Synechococcus sp. BIOS-U3-1]